MPDRSLLVITPCAWPIGPGFVCAKPPAGVDTAAGRFVCAEHLKVLQSRTELPPASEVIEGALDWMRRTWHPPLDGAAS